MPNHVTNVVKFNCDDEKVNEILDFIKDEKKGERGTFDFNTLIPMPPGLGIESGSKTMDAISIYLTAINPEMPDMGVPKSEIKELTALAMELNKHKTYRSKLSEEEIQERTRHTSLANMLALGKQAVTNFKTCGHVDWYSWSIEHWGTKWNAYDTLYNEEEGYLEFLTAWDPVPKIILKLSEEFPDVPMDYKWADEDIGYNCGAIIVEAGIIIGMHLPVAGSKEAFEFSAEVMHENLEDWGYYLSFNTLTYEYRDEEGMNLS